MDESKKDIKRYLDGIESQHKTKPRYMAFVSALLEKIDPSHAVAKDMPSAFDVHTAVGNQLDILGQLVGVDRQSRIFEIPNQPVYLDDESFRKLILAKIVQNQWDGSYEKFKEIWDNTFRGALKATYYDNQDMTMDIHVTGQIEPNLLEMILRGYVLPKPMGVGMLLTVTEEVVADANAAFKPTAFAKLQGSYLHTEGRYKQVNAYLAECEARAGAEIAVNMAWLLALNSMGGDELARREVYAGARAYIDAACVLLRYSSPAPPVARRTVFAAAKMLAEAARVGLPLNADVKRTAGDSAAAGARASADVARIRLSFSPPLSAHRAESEIADGFAVATNAARIFVRYLYSCERQCLHAVSCGIKATANCARLVIAIR